MPSRRFFCITGSRPSLALYDLEEHVISSHGDASTTALGSGAFAMTLMACYGCPDCTFDDYDAGDANADARRDSGSITIGDDDDDKDSGGTKPKDAASDAPSDAGADADADAAP